MLEVLNMTLILLFFSKLEDLFEKNGKMQLPPCNRATGKAGNGKRDGNGNGNGNDEFAIADLVRPLLYVPPSMPVGELLQRMRRGRIHMALIIDEYGGVDGLVTIENLIEIVIGQIEDEHDLDEGKLWTLEEEGRYLVEARTSLKSFREETGVDLTKDLDDEEIDTLGGLVFVLSGRVPARGEIIRHPADIDFEVVDADVRRIKRLRVHLGKPGRG